MLYTSVRRAPARASLYLVRPAVALCAAALLTVSGCADEDPLEGLGDVSEVGGQDATGEVGSTDVAVDVSAPDAGTDVATDTDDADVTEPEDTGAVDTGGDVAEDAGGDVVEDATEDVTADADAADDADVAEDTADAADVVEDTDVEDADAGALDCAGVAGGSSTADDCGVCDDDAGNDNTTCTQDCAGVWGGASAADDCGVCDDNNANNNTTCTQDCAGVWGGGASVDDCGVCDDNAANDNACFGELELITDYVDTYVSQGHTSPHGSENAISFGLCRICPTFGGACTGVPTQHDRIGLLTWPFVSEELPDGATIEQVELVLDVGLAFEHLSVPDESFFISQTTIDVWDADATYASMGGVASFGSPLILDAPQPPMTGEMALDITSLFRAYYRAVSTSDRAHFSISLYSEQCYQTVTSSDLSEDAGPRLRIRYRTE